MLGVMVDFVLRSDPTGGDTDHNLRSAWMVPCTPLLSDRFRDRFGVERISTSYGTSEVGMVARRVVDRSEDVSSGQVLTDHYEVEIAGPRRLPAARRARPARSSSARAIAGRPRSATSACPSAPPRRWSTSGSTPATSAASTTKAG